MFLFLKGMWGNYAKDSPYLRECMLFMTQSLAHSALQIIGMTWSQSFVNIKEGIQWDVAFVQSERSVLHMTGRRLFWSMNKETIRKWNEIISLGLFESTRKLYAMHYPWLRFEFHFISRIEDGNPDLEKSTHNCIVLTSDWPARNPSIVLRLDLHGYFFFSSESNGQVCGHVILRQWFLVFITMNPRNCVRRWRKLMILQINVLCSMNVRDFCLE
jgi:hypothetical protein